MIELGIIDDAVDSASVSAYLNTVKKITRQDWGGKLRGEGNDDWRPLAPSKAHNELTVAEVQRILRDAGFFPNGAIDGICGYRTTSVIRLFQEYVRTVEKDASIGLPDGKAGTNTFGHLKRWRDNRLQADWVRALQAWQSGGADDAIAEYNQWLAFLNKVKQHYLAKPSKMLQMINAYPHAEKTDTLKVAQWDFSPSHIHMVGVRRKGQMSGAQRFDDVIMLLIRGLVFKFQGSTDPGHTSHADGAPFLTQGQHNYHFGWHLIGTSGGARSYPALKPVSSVLPQKPGEPQPGVLVVRSKGDFVLSDDDLARGLERNNSINIHWGGEGGDKNVGDWSEGCQVITGFGYIDHRGEPVSCAGFAAANSGVLGPGKTRGAYNVLMDVAAALSSDLGGIVKYTLLEEEDLALSPEIAAIIQKAREHARKLF